ncbi:hypothetical protein Lalb_Chr13g0297141 [Lupinus albus]|uniref:Uncharacterized protein n=1 Tax=Lupinus albus TaxID=3870 RepID=A0A6A4PIH8_LUPAL|nr:hypothetical protein Lalb_Chr13g0297141 [Lupinus albus]
MQGRHALVLPINESGRLTYTFMIVLRYPLKVSSLISYTINWILDLVSPVQILDLLYFGLHIVVRPLTF